jgi:hypothetical protein
MLASDEAQASVLQQVAVPLPLRKQARSGAALKTLPSRPKQASREPDEGARSSSPAGVWWVMRETLAFAGAGAIAHSWALPRVAFRGRISALLDEALAPAPGDRPTAAALAEGLAPVAEQPTLPAAAV